ncbi:epoxyqueuosine reductase QueH [Burkholderia sp. BCC0405]|uniref:epoxyqueuosine reductase QueH n=1 Tax=Burkholderia sp. BCC0405 TaxID=2676298 RepID=UPI001589C6AD
MTTVDKRKPLSRPGGYSEGGEYNWRTGGGSAPMIEVSQRETFYRQAYCGCTYSPRDANLQRKSNGCELIRGGVMY